MVRTLSHAARACAYAGAKSGAGVPVPPGSVTRGVSARRKTDREKENRKGELTFFGQVSGAPI